MKVCFCGLGSIGKRHLENLTRVAPEFGLTPEIHALRKTERTLDASVSHLIAKQITDEGSLDTDYDIAFITNPTSRHYQTIKRMAENAQNLFIEKPVFDSPDYDVTALNLRPGGVYYVAGTLRYAPVILKLREIIRDNRIYSVRAICSSYLPDWRPGTDYRQNYSAQKKLGGGVDIDLIHEWDYLTALFDFPRTVYRLCGKYSELETDSDDLAVYIADYGNMTAELHLDYFGREPRREIELFTPEGTVTGDLIGNTITYAKSGAQTRFDEAPNDPYLRELRFFLDRIRKGEAFNNIQHSLAVLALARGRSLP